MTHARSVLKMNQTSGLDLDAFLSVLTHFHELSVSKIALDVPHLFV